MNGKKLKIFILSGIFLVVSLLGVYSLSDIKYSTKEGLSYDKKKTDAKYLVDFLEKTYPYFDEVKADTGQDLLKERDKIVSSISRTSSDEEFYKEICELFQRFTYGRTELNIPTNRYDSEYTYLYENPKAVKKHNSEKPSEIASKWESIQKEYRDNLAKSQYTCNIAASYINGSYYITMSQNPEVHVGDEVISINGMSVDDYGKTTSFNRKYYKYNKVYDYDYEKYIVPSPFELRNNPPKEAIIKNSLGEEKKVEVVPLAPEKPMLEDGFKAFRVNSVLNTEGKVQEKFLNTFEDNKVMALNFSAINGDNEYLHSPEGLNKLFSKISESDYLVLDLRLGYSIQLIQDILSFVLPKDVSYYDYKIVEKNEVNNAYINYYKGGTHPSVAEVTSSIGSLEKLYPLSKYQIFKDKKVDLKGMNKYKGKVFILHDKSINVDSINELLKAVVDHNYCTLIANGKFTLMDHPGSSFAISTVLPNSNLAITVQNARLVDENGTYVGKIVVTPQVIIKDDTLKRIDNLKKGEGYFLKMGQEDKYTNKDEYYNEVLKLIK